MIEEAKELIAASSPQSAVYIGCDSIRYRKNNQWYAKYSTVIIVHMEVHLDINPNPKHKSSVAVKEALGWVKGSLGIDAKVKPDSFAATHAADHVVRH